ncbi:mucin-binding protein [Lactobacillus acidophilus]|uniref:mucin-binding protein n=1 Tax=Lactobacillus acidophilus TaxID=1579 RepID=UPI000354F0B2|nr:YSIRK-type signal peptide-containing protein [Lactobacillus acidophilus]MBN3483905.1 YSIRK-type signal peptide-containing protein [Lactobacillus acidophilus]MCT3627141.1 YSIRK-type signal peptide-containing protein [Lactobacillus acidophilus]UEX75047.1 YSIRK-type signal peptide-containing protein [Lactobacillus acidophilus]UIP47559.1 YSIRK-type signal peptide-containing protein [Lactobacillus acidophilus]UTX29729.1 YSIRK-type signal peptide-containing protein [Lactobacillus acidophilus]
MDKKEVKNRFSFRKLSTGLATVFLGSIFFWTNGQTVQADSVEPASEQAVQNVDSQVQADNTVSENTVNEENGSTSETTTEVKTEMPSVDTTSQAKDAVETSDNKKVELPQGEADKQVPQKLEVNKSNQAAETTDKDTKQNATSATPAQLNENTAPVVVKAKSEGKEVVKATDPTDYPTEVGQIIDQDKYIYQILSLNGRSGRPSDSKLVLTTNRNDHNDKNIYAYVVDRNNRRVSQSVTVGVDQHTIISVNGRGYQISNTGGSNVIVDGKEVPTQNTSTVTSGNGTTSPIYGLGNTTRGDYSAIGEIPPVYTENSVIKYYYRDENGNLKEAESSDQYPNVNVSGLTGQEFVIPNVDQYKRVIKGRYLNSDNLPTGDFTGTISQFGEGKYYKKVYYDYGTDDVDYYVVYNQVSPDGTMDVSLFRGDNNTPIESRRVGPGRSIRFTSRNYTARNPYVTETPHEVQFIYDKLGSIVPVDEDGNVIGDLVQFNNSTDPTKAAVTDSPVIAGYTIKDPTQREITPHDPGKNIKVVYVRNHVTAAIKYIDDTAGDDLSAYNKSITAKPGEALNYTTKDSITELQNKGYVLVSDNFNVTTMPENGGNYEVHVKHGTKTIDPDNPTDKYTKKDLQKTATRTINYVDDQGNKIAESVTSTVVFTGTGTVDAVTGNLVNLHPDGSIKDQNGKLTWTYSVDGGVVQKSDTYTFSATTARPTIDHNNSTYNFTSTTPADYNAGNGAVSSYRVNSTDPQNLIVNVVYTKQAIYHAGKTETKSVTRTINYLDGKTGEKIPTDLIATNPVAQTVNLHRTEIIDDNGKVIGYGTISKDGKSYTINNDWVVDGKWASVTSPDLSAKGYKAPRFENGTSAARVDEVIVGSGTKDATVNVYYDHNLIPIGPDNFDKHGVDRSQIEKQVKETVHYVGAGDKTPADHVQTSKWTRTITIDAVTKEVVPNGQYTTDWTIPKGEKTEYAQVNTPVVNGYYADQANVPATTVTQNDIEKTVTYKQIGRIVPVDPNGKPIPDAPTPQYPNDPTDPTKVLPNVPVPNIPGYKPSVPTVTPTDPGKDTQVPYTPVTPTNPDNPVIPTPQPEPNPDNGKDKPVDPSKPSDDPVHPEYPGIKRGQDKPDKEKTDKKRNGKTKGKENTPTGRDAVKRAGRSDDALKLASEAKNRRMTIQGKNEELPQAGEDHNAMALIGLAFATLAGSVVFATDRKRR